MTRALITGATAGLGRRFAEELAAQGYGVVLVARDEERLRDLAAELRRRFGVETEVLPADLADREAVDRVAERLTDPGHPVEVLVNNAGFGIEEGFLSSDIADEQAIIDVMVTAVMRLCHAAAPAMVTRGSGRILNVSSIAGWLTGSTYSAAKAWVTVFTEGLAGDLAGSGVTATAVCPGFTRTEFHQRAEMDMSGVPDWMWLSADDVVREALEDSRKGKIISVAGRQYEALGLAVQYLPRPLVRRLMARRTSGSGSSDR